MLENTTKFQKKFIGFEIH